MMQTKPIARHALVTMTCWKQCGTHLNIARIVERRSNLKGRISMQYIGLKSGDKVYYYNDFKNLAKVNDLVVVSNLDNCTMGEVVEIKRELDFHPTKNLLAVLDRKTVERDRKQANEMEIKGDINYYKSKKSWLIDRHNEIVNKMCLRKREVSQLDEDLDMIDKEISVIERRIKEQEEKLNRKHELNA